MISEQTEKSKTKRLPGSSVGELLSFAWKASKDNILPILMLWGAAFLINRAHAQIIHFVCPSQTMKQAAQLYGKSSGMYRFGAKILIGQMIYALIFVGLYKASLMMSTGQPISWTAIVRAYRVYLKFMAAIFLMQLLTYVGMRMLFIPGVVAGILFVFVPFIVIDKEASVTQAFELCPRLTGRTWKSILVLLLLALPFLLIFRVMQRLHPLGGYTVPVLLAVGWLVMSPPFLISFARLYKLADEAEFTPETASLVQEVDYS
jgi:hypothetical protein